jgi:UDP-N-acetylglucosamine--N-acetylmuramyl-(pentapeptide) pyrophosphoryl-undecaprenol N-acetylglucosamine transferase
MERSGCAEVLYEQVSQINGGFTECLDGKVLADKIVSLAFDDARLAKMRLNNRSFSDRDALARISAVIRAEKMPLDDKASSALKAAEESAHLSNSELLALLEKEYAKNRGGYKATNAVARAEDIEYFKSRADALLTAPEWQARNLGVKLLGLLEAREKLLMLLALFNERRPVSPLKRLFGGDFEQVGFIRRNIVTALTRLNELTPEVEDALLAGMKDPYYEVRAECARAASHFNERIESRESFIAGLMRALDESNLDVCTAAAEAMGRLGGEDDALPALLGLCDTKYWRLRAAALRGVLHLVKRGRVTDLKMVEARTARFVLTSTDFKPEFEIKTTYRELMKAVSGKREANRPQ